MPAARNIRRYRRPRLYQSFHLHQLLLEVLVVEARVLPAPQLNDPRPHLRGDPIVRAQVLTVYDTKQRRQAHSLGMAPRQTPDLRGRRQKVGIVPPSRM
jgi:hypothetical protein